MANAEVKCNTVLERILKKVRVNVWSGIIWLSIQFKQLRRGQ